MFSLTISTGSHQWAFLFREEEKAKQAYDQMANFQPNDRIFVKDDFGQLGLFLSLPLAICLEDLEQSKLAHVERALHQARTQAKAQQMAQSDPALRARSMSGGPAVISPMNGGFHG